MAWEQVLSPEVMQRIQSGVTTGASRGQGGEYFDPATGRSYVPQYNTRYDPQSGDMVSDFSGVRGYEFDQAAIDGKKSRLNGTPYYEFDASGQRTGQGQWTGLKDHTIAQDIAPFAMAALPFAAAVSPGVNAALSFGANPVTGAAGGGAGGAVAGGAGNALSGLPGGAGMDVAGFEGLAAADVGAAGAGAAGAAGAGSSLLPAGASSLVGPALTAGAGLYGAKVAGDAADDQVKAAGDANALLREMFYKNIELNEPFRQGGIAGNNALLTALGLKDGENKGWAMKDFGMADFQADPGYQFRMDEGLKALERSAAARGGLLSGRATKDTMRFAQGLGSQEYGNAYQRFQTNRTNKLNPLQSLAGVGQSVSRDMGNAGMSYAGQAGQNITNAGDARAAGRVGSANAITGAIGQGISQYQNNQLMEQLLRRGV